MQAVYEDFMNTLGRRAANSRMTGMNDAAMMQRLIGSGDITIGTPRGTVEQLGGSMPEVPWEEQSPVSAGAPWDRPLDATDTYGDRLAMAQMHLEAQRENRTPLSDEQRKAYSDAVLRARANRRAVMNQRSELARQRPSLNEQYASMARANAVNRAIARGGFGRGGGITAPQVGLLRIMQQMQQDRLDNDRTDQQNQVENDRAERSLQQQWDLARMQNMRLMDQSRMNNLLQAATQAGVNSRHGEEMQMRRDIAMARNDPMAMMSPEQKEALVVPALRQEFVSNPTENFRRTVDSLRYNLNWDDTKIDQFLRESTNNKYSLERPEGRTWGDWLGQTNVQQAAAQAATGGIMPVGLMRRWFNGG